MKPGETLDLGTIRLKLPRRIAVSHLVTASLPFAKTPPARETILGGGELRTGHPRASLRFNQENREINFRKSVGIWAADVGPGRHEEFLEVNPSKVKFTSSDSIVTLPSHVYLLLEDRPARYVLVQFEIDPETPR